MNIVSSFEDTRINSTNLLVEATFEEYLGFAEKIVVNNEFQRKRVKTFKTIYTLLRNDLKQGCLMPPLVLAIVGDGIDRTVFENGDLLKEYIYASSGKVQILDGLQRTFTLIDADADMRRDIERAANQEEKDKAESAYKIFLQQNLRIEIYTEINKFGILYRMLTLNTGQTPMSSRHQLEMLYYDLLDTQIDGVKLVSDKDGNADPNDNAFVFKNAIEGFHSYLNRTELPIDRQDILDNVKMLEHMSEEDTQEDIFREFLECYIKVFSALRSVTEDYMITDEDLESYELSGAVFARSAAKIFSTSQAFTGFGAAVGRMKDLHIIDSFEDISNVAGQLANSEKECEWMYEMLQKFDQIRNTSKKIGNAQRMYFQYFFRELFNPESDSYLKLESAVENGYKKYYSQV